MNYQEALVYLGELNVFGCKLGLARIERLTELLGMPQDKYKTIHVTGTNGKGSVSAMLSNMLQAAGLKVGTYTSPHLISYTERMMINGQEIPEADFALYLAKVKEAVERMLEEGEESPTQFEVLTALGFLYFAAQKVDYAVIEVGLGGLLDSTNVITPEISVITNVAFEHADKCGGTLEGIARHKAGIIKKGRPVVTGAQGKPLRIIMAQAENQQADLYCLDRDFSVESVKFDCRSQKLNYCFAKEKYQVELSLLGAHQLNNAAVAMTAIKILGKQEQKLCFAEVVKALQQVEWPGRFEIFDLRQRKILIDGAHNPAGMTILRRGLDEYFPTGSRVFLLGILADKDIDGMLQALLRPEDIVVMTPPDSERAASAEVLAGRVKQAKVYAEPDNFKALQLAAKLSEGGALLCCAGSLYLIGLIRKYIIEGKVCGQKK